MAAIIDRSRVRPKGEVAVSLPSSRSGVRRTLAGLWRLMGATERRRALHITVFAAIASGFEAVGLSMIPVFTASVAYPRTPPAFLPPFVADPLVAATGGGWGLVMVLTVVLAGLFACKAVATMLLADTLGRFLERVRVDLGERLVRHHLALPYEEAIRHKAPELVRDLTTELQQTVNLTLRGALELLSELPMALAVVILLLVLSPWVAVSVLAVFGTFSMLVLPRVLRRLREAASEAQQARADLIETALDAFAGLREVRMFDRDEDIAGRIGAGLARQGALTRRSLLYPALLGVSTELLGMLAVLVTLAMLVSRGASAEYVVATMSFFAFALLRLRSVFQRMATSWGTLRQGLVSTSVVVSALPATQEAAREAATDDVLPDFGRIVLRDVGYRHDGADAAVLDGVDLEIRRGEALGIMGPSGAGKTTLLDLLAGLLGPQHGAMLLDDHVLGGSREAWRAQVGLVPQTIHIFDDTLAYNVTFERPPEDPELFERVIEMVGLGPLLATLPDGADTVLGERGGRLSGGERQRIAVARALYRRPQILLLDEATAWLDASAQDAMMEMIARLKGRITTVSVAHRAEALRNCDRIVWLEGGRIGTAPEQSGAGGLVAFPADAESAGGSGVPAARRLPDGSQADFS